MNSELKILPEILLPLLDLWEERLNEIPEEILEVRKNSQNRTIKQILGHMIDSASNNTHRIIHLQYRDSPVEFPNYATLGNNDRWIAIQNYQGEDWFEMVMLWKYIHLHLIHVVNNIAADSLDALWNDTTEHGHVSLKEMVLDFPRHFELHINEIEEILA